MLYTESSHLILIQHLILKIILWEKHHQFNITEKKKKIRDFILLPEKLER